MLGQIHLVGVGHQGVARDAGDGLVGLGHAAVDDDQLARHLDGALALADFHGDVAVDDDGLGVGDAELLQHAVTGLRVVGQGEIGVGVLLVQLLVLDKVALEGGHLVFAEQRRLAAAPEIPHEVRPALAPLLVLGVAALAHQLLAAVKETAAAAAHAVDVHFGKAAVGFHRDAAVEHQAAVVVAVHGAFFVEKVYMALELVAVEEGDLQTLQHLLLSGREGVGVGRVDGREIRVPQGVLRSADGHDAAREIHLVQQHAVVHAVLGVELRGLALDLELDDGHGLVHLGDDLVVVGVGLVAGAGLGHEAGAGVVCVGLEGKEGQGPHVDAVAALHEVVVFIAQADAHGVGDAAQLARGRAHPEDVVVAPLDVDVALLFQLVHHEMGAVAAVKDVAHDVESVDDGVVHQMAHGDDEAVGGVGVDDGLDDLAEVVLLVEILAAGGHELGDDVLIVLGQHTLDLGAGVFRGRDLADGDELLERDGVPLGV